MITKIIAAVLTATCFIGCGSSENFSEQIGVENQSYAGDRFFQPVNDFFPVSSWLPTTCDANHNCSSGGDESSKVNDWYSPTVGNTFVYMPPSNLFQCNSLEEDLKYVGGASPADCQNITGISSVVVSITVYTGASSQNIPLQFYGDTVAVTGGSGSFNVPALIVGGRYSKAFSTNPMTNLHWTPGDFGCGGGSRGTIHQEPYIGWCAQPGNSGWSMGAFAITINYTY